MTQLDQVTNGWMPDTYQLYGDKLYDYNLCDSRYIQHDERFMITNNVINPKVYQVTKVQDLVPLGIIKMTFKQTEVDKTVDNIDLLLCNYYNRMGEVRLKEPIDISVENRTSIIYHAIINDHLCAIDQIKSSGHYKHGDDNKSKCPVELLLTSDILPLKLS